MMPVRHATRLASDRRISEDRAEVFDVLSYLVVVVADGAGGLRGGATACDTFTASVRETIGDGAVDLHDPLCWQNVLRSVDVRLARQMAGETTGVVLVVGTDQLFGASVGDSEAWLINASSIDVLTASQKRSRLGTGRATPVPFRRAVTNGSLVIATDGLFKYAKADLVADAVRTERDPARAAQALARLAQTRSGSYHDDVAIVVVMLDP